MSFGTDAFGESAFGEEESGSVATIVRPFPPGRISPAGRFRPPVRQIPVGGTTTCTVTGMGPNEHVGIPVATLVVPTGTISPTGLASTNAFGVPTLSSASAANINPIGIAPTEQVYVPLSRLAFSDVLADSPRVLRRPPGRISPAGLGFIQPKVQTVGVTQTISPYGIPLVGTYTTERGAVYTNQAGDPYTVEQFVRIGVPAVANQTGVHPSGIASSNAFGVPTLSTRAHLSPTGIPSTNGFGVPSVSGASSTVTIHPTGIPSTNAFGVIGHLSINPFGIASTNRFGVPIVKRAATWNVKEPYGRWQVGFPRQRWFAFDPDDEA